MPSFQNTFAGDLLPHTLSRTLPAVVEETLRLANERHPKKPFVYADSAISRCQETAVSWAEALCAHRVCGVPTGPEVPADPRVNQTAAEKSLDLGLWTTAQQSAAQTYTERAQLLWQELLCALGFDITPGCVPGGAIPSDGLGRALFFLGLPQTAFLFATTVVMAFGLNDTTAFKEFANAGWPRPREKNGKLIFIKASSLLGIVLAVRYPKGYVANTMSTALARLFLEPRSRSRFTVVCTHEEHMNFFRAALDLGDVSYARPVSALVFVPKKKKKNGNNNLLKVFEVHNPVSRKGRVDSSATYELLGQIDVARIQTLANQAILPVPDFVCR
jgi:hypothetical protein